MAEKASYPGRAKKDAFHARCTVTMTTPTGHASAIVNILAAISCFVLSSARCPFCCKRSNTFCRHCCPVMGKNFCDWKSEVTRFKEFFLPTPTIRLSANSARHWHWIRRLQLEAKTLEIVFPSPHCPPGQWQDWQQDLWNPGLVFYFCYIFLACHLSVGGCSTSRTFCTRSQCCFNAWATSLPTHYATVYPFYLRTESICIEINVPRCAWTIFGSCKYFIDYYSVCSWVPFACPCPYCSECRSLRMPSYLPFEGLFSSPHTRLYTFVAQFRNGR